MRKRRLWLLALAAAGLMLALGSLRAGSAQRDDILRDTGETRASVESAMERLFPVPNGDESVTATSPGLAPWPERLKAADQLAKERYVSAVWVVDLTGQVKLDRGQAARSNVEGVDFNVRDMADPELVAELDAARARTRAQPWSSKSPDFDPEAVATLTQDAMSRPTRDHGDVWRFTWRAFSTYEAAVATGPADAASGIVVVRYDVSPLVAAPPATYFAALVGIIAGAVLFLVSAAMSLRTLVRGRRRAV